MKSETLLIVSNGFGHRSFSSPSGRSTALVRNGLPTKISRNDWERIYENPVNTKELKAAIESGKIEILHIVDNHWVKFSDSDSKDDSELTPLVEKAKTTTKKTSKPASSTSKQS